MAALTRSSLVRIGALVSTAAVLLAGCAQPNRGTAGANAPALPPGTHPAQLNDFGLLGPQPSDAGAPPATAASPIAADQALSQARSRQARFSQLAAAAGDPATIDILYAAPGAAPRIAGRAPVLHVVFPERAFFDFDADQPRPEADRAVRLVAQALAQDTPDTCVTVLGHTDAVGSDAYNIDLSRRRAQSVLSMLVADGVAPDTLTLVAIGKRQPLASNDSDQGRALNRRVEFLISSSLQANLDVVATRPVDPALLSPEERAAPPEVHVYRGTQGGGTGQIQDLVLHQPEPLPDIAPYSGSPVAPLPAGPALRVARPTLTPVAPRAPAPHPPEPKAAVPLEIHPRTPEPETSS